jgi:hypothetical protein
MRLEEELMHIHPDKFAVDHRAGPCVRRLEAIPISVPVAIASIAIPITGLGGRKEALVVALVHNAVDELGLPGGRKLLAGFHKCAVFPVVGKQL